MTSPTIYLLDRREASRSTLAAAERRLSAEDRARYARFERIGRGEEFVLGRALLRWAVARAMDCRPSAFEITSRADGRAQVVALGGSVPRFSLSHSGDWIACALHPNSALGLDVECMDATRDFTAISTLTFGADEHAWLLRQPAVISAFYQLWTGREALTKIAFELDSPATATNGALVAGGGLVSAPAPARGWHHTEVCPGVALSLVWESDVGEVRTEFVDAGATTGLFAD